MRLESPFRVLSKARRGTRLRVAADIDKERKPCAKNTEGDTRIRFPLCLQVLSAAVRSVLHMVHCGHASRDADPLCGLPARAVGGAHGGAGRLPAVTGKC
jgi:hypothetical protein